MNVKERNRRKNVLYMVQVHEGAERKKKAQGGALYK